MERSISNMASVTNEHPEAAGSIPADDSPLNRLVSQWERERPDLDPAPMRVFGLVARAHTLSTEYLNNLLSDRGLNRGTFDVLSALRRAGKPHSLTPKQLSQSLMLSGAGMTGRLDRLESMSLVMRKPDSQDRRSLHIELTDKGRALIDSLIPEFVAGQHQIINQLGKGGGQDLCLLLTTLSDALEGALR